MSLWTILNAPRATSVSAIATSSRCLSTSQPVLAAAKGAAAPKKKKKTGKFGKGRTGSKSIMGPMTHGIKLSYAMASPLPDLSDLTVMNAEALSSGANVGLPTTFSRSNFDAIKTFGLPRKLEKELTGSGLPASVIRQSTLDIYQTIRSQAGSSSENARFLLSGVKGSGKSLLLVQAVAQALATPHIVIYAPQTVKWIDGSAEFHYDPKSQTFHQPTLARTLLESILTVNGTRLASLKMSEGGQSLVDYAREAIRDETRTAAGLEEVMDVLAKQTTHPVFMAFDDVQCLFTETKYRTPTFALLQSYNLSMPRLALDYITGRKTLARGTIISAYSHTTPNVPLTPTFLYALSLPSPQPLTAYTPHDPVHLAHATSNIQQIALPFGMSTKEANGMFEIWSRKGWTPKTNDELFMGVYSSSLGNPKEIARSLWSSRMAVEQYDPRIGEVMAGL